MSTDLPSTRCSDCGRRYRPTPAEPHRCACGGPLELEDDLRVPEPLEAARDGLAAISATLPGPAPVDLGAGGTPAVEVSKLEATCKLEFCNPTGSFKDRGAALTAARARALGAASVREDSSGNAARALAAHGARADLDVRLFVPAALGGSTIEGLERTGASVVPVEGDRGAVEAACLDADDGWYASHAWRPEFYAGTATLAFELFDDERQAPESVVLPVGHGTLLLGLFRGFRTLRDAGRIDDLPRLIAAQPADGGSLVDDTPSGAHSLAMGVRIGAPARESQVRAAIDATDGRVVAVEPEAIRVAHADLLRTGLEACSTAAVAAAGRRQLPLTDPTVVLTGRERFD